MESASPSTSPPRTPLDPRTPANNPRKTATPTSDESSIDDLSFDYVLDEDGNFRRISKGSSKASTQYTPPTPPDDVPESKRDVQKPPSPMSLNSPILRSSLSRSESAYPILETTSTTAASERPEPPVRSFSRTASGPVLPTNQLYAASAGASAPKSRLAPRRVTLDDAIEKNDLVSTARSRPPLEYQEEKENIGDGDENQRQISISAKRRHSPSQMSRSSSRLAMLRTTGLSSNGTRPADVPVPQRGQHARSAASVPSRAARMLKSTSASIPKYSGSVNSGVDRTQEPQANENEYPAMPSSIPANYNGNHSPTGFPLSGDETDPGDDAGVEPANNPISSSAMFARQRNLVISNAAAANSMNQPSINRPRRSASLSDASVQDDYQLQVQHQYMNSQSRPGTSLGMNVIAENPDGARRVTVKEREKQEAEILSDCEKYVRESETEHRERNLPVQSQPRHTPSPTHNQNLHQARLLAYGHRRQDSDTVKGALPPGNASPTVVDNPHRLSAKLSQSRLSPPSRTPRERISPPSSRLQARISPSSRNRASPSTSGKGRLSPQNGKPAVGVSREYAKHRRNPTAPEAPTTSNLVSVDTSVATSGKTWAAGDREEDYDHRCEREKEHDRERQRESQPQVQTSDQVTSTRQSSPPPPYSTQQQHPAPAPAPTPAPASASAQAIQASNHAPPPPIQSPRQIVVNKKAYARLDMIGKGGSSRVFRVMGHNNELYAIKRVSLDRTDNEMMSGYMNEIALLKRLEGNSRIIRLIDSEVRAGPGGSKGHLMLVMECGEVDLARLLQEQMKDPLNMVWVAYYWQQMLQAVHVIHEEKIVHSDLKPANFVLVRGQLKLIDFGIANAIANDTTNIQRDHQVGTINYMSPEAIELPDGMRRLKVGRPSDVWSLGVILYQMVYGQPPFQHLPFIQKMRAIPDHNHVIEFPEHSVPTIPATKNATGDQVSAPTRLDHLKRRVRKDVIESMKKCLTRNPKERATIPELLEHNWLSMRESELNAPEPPKPQLAADETIINPYYMRQLLQYGIKLGVTQGDAMDADTLLKEAERLVAELKALQV